MTNQVDLNQTLELRDPTTGRTLGYLQPVRQAESPPAKELERLRELETERQQWEGDRKELVEERDRLRAELASIRVERDQYLKSLYALTRKEFTFDEKELQDLENNGVTLDQVIQEIKQYQGA